MVRRKRFSAFIKLLLTGLVGLGIGLFIARGTQESAPAAGRASEVEQNGYLDLETIGLVTPQHNGLEAVDSHPIDVFLPREDEPELLTRIRERATLGFIIHDLSPVWSNQQNKTLVTRLNQGELVTIIQLLPWSREGNEMIRYIQIEDRFGNRGIITSSSVVLLEEGAENTYLGVREVAQLTRVQNLPETSRVLMGRPTSQPVLIINSVPYLFDPRVVVEDINAQSWKYTVDLIAHDVWEGTEIRLSLTAPLEPDTGADMNHTFALWAVIGLSEDGVTIRFQRQELLPGKAVQTRFSNSLEILPQQSAGLPIMETSMIITTPENSQRLFGYYQPLAPSDEGTYLPRERQDWSIPFGVPLAVLQHNAALRRTPSLQGGLIQRLPRGTLVIPKQMSLPRGTVARQPGYWIAVELYEEPETQGWIWGEFLPRRNG